ncbi:hypothetical protein Dimus_016719 [Dionaea muscipula]
MSMSQPVYYNGKTIEAKITNKASKIDSWVNQMLSKHIPPKHPQRFIIAGLDCKYKFYPCKSMRTRIATLQLCIDSDCLVIQLLHLDMIPDSLGDFLGNRSIVFVGVEILENLRKLWGEYGLQCSKAYDLRALARVNFPLSFGGVQYCSSRTRSYPSLKALGYWLVGLESCEAADGHHCLREIDSEVLDLKQIEIACVDAYASHSIGLKLLEHLAYSTI